MPWGGLYTHLYTNVFYHPRTHPVGSADRGYSSPMHFTWGQPARTCRPGRWILLHFRSATPFDSQELLLSFVLTGTQQIAREHGIFVHAVQSRDARLGWQPDSRSGDPVEWGEKQRGKAWKAYVQYNEVQNPLGRQVPGSTWRVG